MSGMNESFLSNITPRNLYSLTTGISESSPFRTRSLCIFLREQKCSHLVLGLENLNPFSLAHLFWLSLVGVAALLYSYEWPDSI